MYTNQYDRIAIVGGIRTPLGKMMSNLSNLSASDLGAVILKEQIRRLNIKNDEIDEVITGNVSQPADTANISRVIALKAGVDISIPAVTVHRNCASGMEAISTAVTKIQAHKGQIYAVIGTESMSNIPLLYSSKYQDFLYQLSKTHSFSQKLQIIKKFRIKFLKPKIALMMGLRDPMCNMMMGDTAELLAKEYNISRDEQDEFACKSHNNAELATNNNILQEEIYPVIGKNNRLIFQDEGIRNHQTTQALGKLKPFFDKKIGTVTAGNSSQITDGAACCFVMSETKAKQLNLTPLGFIKDFIYTGNEPQRMGLGPVYAITKLLLQHNMKLSDFNLIEINEAFAAQVLACQKLLSNPILLQKKLGINANIGILDNSLCNVNGGSIALGHPVGMTGTRIVIHLLRELKRRNQHLGLATLCIGGGQGAAFILESE